LAIYLPFIQPVQKFYPASQGIDLGCGRGEWLELMQDNGVAMLGVDMDHSMLEVARERKLNAIFGDAIQSLQALASDSQILVSGFHLVEHLPFEVLQRLIQESLRVLKPGGLLILETPNPENLTVGTEKFYLDPSHLRPIPSQFLSFMTEFAGFERNKVLRLQEPLGLADADALILLSVLNGVSPDYAVVAQKGGASEISEATVTAFEADYGLSLENLANNYDRQIKRSIQKAHVKAEQAEVALMAIYNSSSWKITAPLRKISVRLDFLWGLFKTVNSGCQNKIMLPLLHAALYFNRRPKFILVTRLIFSLFPSIKQQVEQTVKVAAGQRFSPFVIVNSTDLTPRARQVYKDLKEATMKIQKVRR
jgi:O-antigen chain-terminating methyltransferase